MLLLVEVSDATLPFDRETKAAIYARAGVPEYWIVDVAAGEIEVCRDPGADDYRRVRRFRRSDVVRPAAFPELALPVDGVVG